MATLAEKVEKLANDLVKKEMNESNFLDAAKKIEGMKKYKIKDYDTAFSHFLQQEVELYKQKEKNGKVIGKESIETIDTAKRILDQAKQIRRDRNKQTSKVDTNILTASPFFVGRNRKLIEEGKEKGYIAFEQGGIRKLTYHNDQGSLLTYNDAKTLFALFALWEEQGQTGWLSFTEYALLDKMNMGYGGRQYQILRDSLEKLRSTSVVLQEAFDIQSGKRYITERFPLIIADKFTLDEDESGRVRSKLYEIQFSPYIYESIQNGYYSLISLALWDEIGTDGGKAIYSMISGICNMDSNNDYIREDGSYELPVKTVYKQLKLENARNAFNKTVVERACEELKSIDVINEYYFKSVGSRVHSLVIEPSQWLNDVLSKSINNSKTINLSKQLNLPI